MHARYNGTPPQRNVHNKLLTAQRGCTDHSD